MSAGRNTTRGVALALLLLAGCSAPPTAPPLPSERYRLQLQSSEGTLGAVLLTVSGGAEDPILLPESNVLGSVSEGASPARLLLVGAIGGVDLLEVKSTTPGTAPSAVVLEASADATGGYRAITAGSVTMTWVGVARER
jgi:hypothetical protein